MKIQSLLPVVCSFALLGGARSASAATLQLNATMNVNGYMTESQFTGGGTSMAFAATDPAGADAWYTLPNAVFNTSTGSYTTGPRAGTPITVFTTGTSFNWGSLTYDEGLLSGTGVETIAIQSASLDVSGSIDQNLGYDGTPASVTGLGLVFFDSIVPITFGGIDANDTLTFTDGVLTGINLEVTTSMAFSAFGFDPVYNGTFSIDGFDLLFSMNDTYTTFFGSSTVVWDLPGTVNAVPEPSAGLLLSAGLGVLACRRARRR